MTPTEYILAAGVLVNAIAAIGGLFIGLRNGTKIEAVHKSTNGLSERNEAIARKLGVEEGKATERAVPK